MRLRRFPVAVMAVCVFVSAVALQARTTSGQTKLSMPGFPSQGEPAKVTVIATGAEPKKALRYTVPADFKGKLEMVTTMTMAMNVMGQAMDMPVPAIKLGADLVITNVAPNGDISYTVTFNGMTLEGDATGPLAQALQAGTSSINGVKATTVMSNRGVTKSTKIDATDPAIQTMMSQMSSSIENLSTAFPEEAVGVGAKWEVRQAITGGGQTQFQKAIYEVTSMSGKTVSLKVTTEQSAPPQTVDNPMAAATGAEMTLEKMSGTGTGTMTIMLDSLVPTGTSESTTSTAMTMTMGGQAIPVTADGKIKITIGPGKDK